jgi:hypothetical protein
VWDKIFYLFAFGERIQKIPEIGMKIACSACSTFTSKKLHTCECGRKVCTNCKRGCGIADCEYLCGECLKTCLNCRERDSCIKHGRTCTECFQITCDTCSSVGYQPCAGCGSKIGCPLCGSCMMPNCQFDIKNRQLKGRVIFLATFNEEKEDAVAPIDKVLVKGAGKTRIKVPKSKQTIKEKTSKRNVSQTMLSQLQKNDPEFCDGQSDLDGLYNFTMRNLDGFKEFLPDAQETFAEHVLKLRKIIDALIPDDAEFETEWQKYQSMFIEHFTHAKISKKQLEFIVKLFDLDGIRRHAKVQA